MGPAMQVVWQSALGFLFYYPLLMSWVWIEVARP